MSIKKVYLVTKTHLDLGYTDLAANILSQYIDDFIPEAIRISKKLNKDKKKFVWTTGSWILAKALQMGTKEQQVALDAAMQRGDIVAHGFPFTTHTELMDEDVFRYGMSIIKNLDKRFSRNTISAKMTDVPGHTKAMIPFLREYGIKMLHIGVNESSAIPDVPDVFLWEFEGSEVVVVYNKSYGGDFTCEGLDSMVAFCHTSDNCGPVNLEQALSNYEHYEKLYPNAEIIASGLDEIAEELWEIRGSLPVLTSEIGDSWIHGSTTDPFKAGAFRALMQLKDKWLREGELSRDSEEYNALLDVLLCLAEHTNGGDIKVMLSDYTNYLKDDFKRAKERDIVENSKEALEAEERIASRIISDIQDRTLPLSYTRLMNTWKEQREYINEAIESLSQRRKEEASLVIQSLIPKRGFAEEFTSKNKFDVSQPIEIGEYSISLNDFGALKIKYKGELLLNPPEEGPLFDYISHSTEDVAEFFQTYNRPDVRDKNWAYGDFGRPAFSLMKGKYPTGRYPYVLSSAMKDEESVVLILKINHNLSEKLGAPREIQLKLSVEESNLILDVIWLDKDENRIQEETLFRVFPAVSNKDVRFKKLASYIDPYDVVENGNRSCSGILDAKFKVGDKAFTIENVHCPLVSLGKGKIMRFDNIFESVERDGLSFVLHNNIWGTNFPIWYGDNAYFRFIISPKF